MANVPREYGPSVQAQPLQPQYQSARGADQSAFGTAVDARGLQQTAQAVEQFGNTLLEAQGRIQERNDAVARAREFGAFGEFATTSLTALQDTGDIADPRTVATYRQQLDEKIAEMVGNHAGSEDSRAVLQARLYEQRSSLLDQAAVTSAAAGRKAVTDQLGTELSIEAAAVSADPTQFTAAMARWNSKVDDFAGALDPEQERTFRKQGPAAFVGAAIDNILMQPNGDQEAMKLIQSSPGLMSFLSPPEQQALQQRIRVVAQANAAERNKTYTLSPGAKLVDSSGKVIARGDPVAQPKSKGAEALEALTMFAKFTGLQPTPDQVSHVLGLGDLSTGTQSWAAKSEDFVTDFKRRLNREPTEAEMQKFYGVDRPDRPQSLTEKVTEIRQILGKEGRALTEEQLNRVIGIHSDPTMTLSQKVAEAERAIGRPLVDTEIATLGNFYMTPEKPEAGPDLESDTLTVFSNLGARFGAGETTALEDRQFISAVTDYTQQRQTGSDPDTNLPIYGRNELPPFVVKALTARGYEVPGAKETAEPSAAGSQDNSGKPGSPAPQGDSGPPTKANAEQQTGQMQPTDQGAGQPQPGQSGGAAQREPTIYELAPNVAGVSATLKGAVGRAPIIGGGNPKEVTAQSRVQTAQSTIISALRNVDTRFLGQVEREQLEQRLDIAGGLEDPLSYQQRLVGIDIDLEKRLDNALETAANKKTTKEARQAALDAINTIRQVREQLLPDRFDTAQEAAEWAASQEEGTPFLFKKGDSYETRVVRKPKPAAGDPNGR